MYFRVKSQFFSRALCVCAVLCAGEDEGRCQLGSLGVKTRVSSASVVVILAFLGLRLLMVAAMDNLDGCVSRLKYIHFA